MDPEPLCVTAPWAPFSTLSTLDSSPSNLFLIQTAASAISMTTTPVYTPFAPFMGAAAVFPATLSPCTRTSSQHSAVTINQPFRRFSRGLICLVRRRLEGGCRSKTTQAKEAKIVLLAHEKVRGKFNAGV